MARRMAGEQPRARQVPLEQLEDQVTAYIRKLCEPIVERGVIVRMRPEPDITDELTYRFYVYVDGGSTRLPGYLIGTGGSGAQAIRTLVRTFVSARGSPDNVDVRVMRQSADATPGDARP